MSRVSFAGGLGTCSVQMLTVTSTAITTLFAASNGNSLREVVVNSTAGIGLSSPLYIGGTTLVSTTAGHAVPADQPFRLPVNTYRGPLYGIAPSGASLTVTTFSC